MRHVSAGARLERLLLGLSYHGRGPLLWDLLHERRIRVLIYHGIPDRAATDGITNRYGYSITAAEFERHVDYLRRRCHVMSLDDALAGRGLSRTRINVVVSFDDGYANNFTNGFRILSAAGMPAVYALTTGFVCRREPLWNDVVEYAVTRAEAAPVSFEWHGQARRWDLTRHEERVALYDWLLVQCTSIEQTERDVLLERAVAALGVSGMPQAVFEEPEYRPMEAEQVREMAASGLAELASHGVRHHLLTRLGAEERREELVRSKREVEELTGRPCRTFCVPGGQYDAAIVQELFDAGYERVLTSDGGFSRAGQRLLGREGVYHHTDAPRFADLVHGPVAPVMRRLRRLRGTAAR